MLSIFIACLPWIIITEKKSYMQHSSFVHVYTNVWKWKKLVWWKSWWSLQGYQVVHNDMNLLQLQIKHVTCLKKKLLIRMWCKLCSLSKHLCVNSVYIKWYQNYSYIKTWLIFFNTPATTLFITCTIHLLNDIYLFAIFTMNISEREINFNSLKNFHLCRDF